MTLQQRNIPPRCLLCQAISWYTRSYYTRSYSHKIVDLDPTGAPAHRARRVGARRVGAQRAGAQRVAAQIQKKSGPEGWRDPNGGWPNISRFFFSCSHCRFFFFHLFLGVSSWNCGRGSRPRPTQSARLGFSGVILCEPPRPASRWGFTQ